MQLLAIPFWLRSHLLSLLIISVSLAAQLNFPAVSLKVEIFYMPTACAKIFPRSGSKLQLGLLGLFEGFFVHLLKTNILYVKKIKFPKDKMEGQIKQN